MAMPQPFPLGLLQGLPPDLSPASTAFGAGAAATAARTAHPPRKETPCGCSVVSGDGITCPYSANALAAQVRGQWRGHGFGCRDGEIHLEGEGLRLEGDVSRCEGKPEI